RIDVSEDGREYTFHLRANGRWTNGDAVTAGDFVFGWRRMLENPDEYSGLFHCIAGAKEYQAWYVDWRNAKRLEWAGKTEEERFAEAGERMEKVRQEADARFESVGVEVVDLQ